VCGLWNGSGAGLRAQARVRPPPIHSDLFRFVDRTDEKANLNSEELDVGEVDLDVADNDQALIEHAIENIDEPIAPRRGY